MKKLFLFFLTVMMSTVCNAQLRDQELQAVNAEGVADVAVVQTIPYQQIKGYIINNPTLIRDKQQLYTTQAEFEQAFSATKKAKPINFDTHYVVMVSPNTQCKCKKFKVEDVFYNNAGQIIVKTFAKCDEYRTTVTRLRVNPDGSKVAVYKWEGEPYAKAVEKQPYILIAIAKANKGSVANVCVQATRANGRLEGTKAERKEIYELEKQGKVIFEE